jgi:hypothetical protein
MLKRPKKTDSSGGKDGGSDRDAAGTKASGHQPPVLTGIIFDAKSRGLRALVEDRNPAKFKLFKDPLFLKPGDSLLGYAIESISSERVVVRWTGMSKEIKIGEPLPAEGLKIKEGGVLPATSPEADTGPAPALSKVELKEAVRKLGLSGYGWTSTSRSESDAQAGRTPPGPQEGKTVPEGFIWISSRTGETTNEAILCPPKGAIRTPEGWKTLEMAAPADAAPGRRDPSSFFARSLRTFKPPAASLEAMVEKLGDLRLDGSGSLEADLTEEAVKELLSRGGRPGQNPPAIAEAKGWAKFWVKDGVLSRCEYMVSASMTYGERTVPISRTTTVEFRDIGSTKIEIPDEAKQKLN